MTRRLAALAGILFAAAALTAGAWWAAGRASVAQHAALAQADAAPAEAQKPAPGRAELLRLAGKHWYRVSIMGKPSGWMYSHTWVEDGPDGRPRVRMVNRMVFEIVLNGVPLKASSEISTVADSRLRTTKVVMVSNEIGRSKTVTAEAADGVMRVRVEAGGQSYTRELAIPDDWGSELEFALRASSGALQPGEKFTVSIFDPQLIAFERHHVTVGQWRKIQVGGKPRKVIVLEDETEKLKLKSRTYIDAEGVMWRQEVPGMLNMVLEKVPEAEARKMGKPLSLTNRVDVDRPLPPVRSLRRLVLAVSAGGQAPAPTTDRQKVSALGGGRYRLELRAEKPPETVVRLPVKPPPDIAHFVAPTSIAQTDNGKIKATAAEVTRGCADAWEAARAIVSWVYEHMKKVASEPRPVSAAEIIQSMTGDCTEHAVLAGTLARAVGLPTKLCVGLAYTGGAFYYHAWIKAWVGEWVEMDPTWGEATVDPSHITVGEGDFDELSLARVSLATARTIGRLKIKVVDFEKK